MYTRQGAGWPVDVFVIAGKGKSERAYPAVTLPRVYKTWEALKEAVSPMPRSWISVKPATIPDGFLHKRRLVHVCALVKGVPVC